MPLSRWSWIWRSGTRPCSASSTRPQQRCNADDKTLGARLRKAIDSATRIRGFVDYREAQAGQMAWIPCSIPIADLASGQPRRACTSKLAERAIDRIEQAIEEIDDSDGHCGMLLLRARDIHLAAIREIRPEPVQLARDLFAREMQDDLRDVRGRRSTFTPTCSARPGSPNIAASPPRRGRNCPRAMAAGSSRSWRSRSSLEIPVSCCDSRFLRRARRRCRHPHCSARQGFVLSVELSATRRVLPFARPRGGGASPGRGGPLVVRGRAAGRAALYSSRPSFCRRRAERRTRRRICSGLSRRRRASNSTPRLRKFGGKAARERVVKFLEAGQIRGRQIRWYNPADLLIHIWMQEKRFDEAWASVRTRGASLALREELAGQTR